MAFFDHDYDLGPRLGARHVAPGRFRDAPRNDFLSPNHMRHEYHVSAGGGIRRSRSTGTRPAPNIQIFNNLEQDNHPRFDANANARVSPPRTPRGRVMEDEWADHRSPSRGRMFHDHHHDHHHFRFPESPDNRATQVALQDQRIRDLEERLRRENEEELLRMKYDNELLRDKREREEEEDLIRRRIELQMLKDKVKREEEENRIRHEEERLKDKYERQRAEADRKRLEHERELKQIKDEAIRKEKDRIEKEEAAREAAAQEWERRKEAAKKKEDEKKAAQLLAWQMEERKKADEAAAAAKKAEEDRKRMIEEHEANAARQAKEEAEKKQRIIDQYHKDKKDAAEKARAAEEALKIKMEKEAKEAAEKAKQEEEEYERKRLAKIEKEKKEKAEADEKFEKEMHERLHKMGFSEEQIQAMIKGEKAKENNQVIVNVGGHRHHRHGIPTYIKIHKNHLEVATLTYFGLPWEYDRADSDYIIILKEIDHNETEVLFEHTKSLRRRTTLRIEERPRASGKPELMWVRRRGRSKSAVRNIHIKDTFF
ncbi:hypothetical protein HDK64DRAFT_53906 [Phyllosticta capitalensis]|uniref:Uncharacterized protein n=1 Tax=Phyllosticta capitalensis TaxID=121624 RepID=A0ABR1YW92_9PEZI